MNNQSAGLASLFTVAARAERTPQEYYTACANKEMLHAFAGEYGYEHQPCVEIRGANDKRIEVIFPSYPFLWAQEFNAIVAEAHNVQKA